MALVVDGLFLGTKHLPKTNPFCDVLLLGFPSGLRENQAPRLSDDGHDHHSDAWLRPIAFWES